MIRTIFIISFFVTGWQASADSKKIASHPVHRKFVTIKNASMKGNICIIKTKELGVLKSRAFSYEKAFSKGIESCFQKQTTFFIKTKKQDPGHDEQIQFTNTCLKNIRCL